VASVNPGRVTVQDTVHGLQNYLTSQGTSPPDALQQTYALIGQGVSGQARLWSYVDDFRYMALVCFGCIPIAFLLKKSVGKKGALRAGH
jgi:DHA2 family multidrug resistance protein